MTITPIRTGERMLLQRTAKEGLLSGYSFAHSRRLQGTGAPARTRFVPTYGIVRHGCGELLVRLSNPLRSTLTAIVLPTRVFMHSKGTNSIRREE
jgi:hypothetical protein